MQEVRQSQRTAAKGKTPQAPSTDAQQQQPVSQPSYFPQPNAGTAQHLASLWAAHGSGQGLPAAFYNAGLYGGMPLPYGFPGVAPPADSADANRGGDGAFSAGGEQPIDASGQDGQEVPNSSAAATAAASLPAMLNPSQAQQLAMALSSAPGGLSAGPAATLAALQQHMQQQTAQAQQQMHAAPVAAAQQAAPAPAAAPTSQAAPGIITSAWQSADPSGSGDLGDPQDEREAKRLRRKQSNRESARRSRMKKQAECEGLAETVQRLSTDNSRLKEENLQLQAKVEVLMSQLHGQKPFNPASAAAPADHLALPQQPVA